MIVALLGLALGIIIGYYIPLNIPTIYSSYTAIALLAAIDTAFGGIRSSLENKFQYPIFVTGFFSNTLIAALLTYLGDRIGVQLGMAAIVAFGVRIFENLATIRRFLLEVYIMKK